jgi:hypothetical protein
MSNLIGLSQWTSACGTAAVLVALGLVVSASSQVPPADTTGTDKAAVFPHVQGSNLEGRKFNLPEDFEGELDLVFVAFQREQQTLVDSWLPLAKTLTARYEGLRYYELPTIYRANSLVRWFINNGMRSGIPDQHARESTITLYIDKEPFRAALGIPDEQTIHVLLIDAAGRVIWRTTDAHAAEKEKDLENAISNVLPKKTN